MCPRYVSFLPARLPQPSDLQRGQLIAISTANQAIRFCPADVAGRRTLGGAGQELATNCAG